MQRSAQNVSLAQAQAGPEEEAEIEAALANLMGERSGPAAAAWTCARTDGPFYGLMLCDVFKGLAVLPDQCVDALITDPPYSSGGFTRGDRAADPRKKYVYSETQTVRETFTGDNKDQRSYFTWCREWLSECYRVLTEGAPVLLFSDWRQLPVTTDALQAAGFIWRGIAPWDKGLGARPECGRFRNQAEYVVWGSKGTMRIRNGGPCHPGVFRHSVRPSDKFHLTGKPTELMRELVKIVPPGAGILDPFSGSGSTLVASLLEGRSCVGFEISGHYHEVAVARAERTIAQMENTNAESA